MGSSHRLGCLFPLQTVVWSVIGLSLLLGLPFWIFAAISMPWNPFFLVHGVFLAMAALIVIYAALNQRKLLPRLSVSMLLALACYGAWYGTRYVADTMQIESADLERRAIIDELSKLAVCSWCALMPLASLRMFFGWHVARKQTMEVFNSRFSILDSFLLTTAIAATFGYLAWAKVERQYSFKWSPLLLGGVGAAVLVVVTIPVALLVALRPATPRRKLAYGGAYVLCLTTIPANFILLTTGFSEYAFAAGLAAANATFAATLMGALLLADKLGYELHWKTAAGPPALTLPTA